MRFSPLTLLLFLTTGCGTGSSSASSNPQPAAGPQLLSCDEVDRARSQGGEITTADQNRLSYCFEFDGENRVPNLTLRFFNREPSGALSTRAVIPTQLTAHRMKSGRIEILARHRTLLVPVGQMDQPIHGLSLEGEGDRAIARLTLTPETILSLNSTEAKNANFNEYGLDDAQHFSGEEYPVRGLLDIEDIAIVMDLAPFLSPAFSADQRSMAYSSVRTYVSRGFRASVLKCTLQKAGADSPYKTIEDLIRLFAQLGGGNDLGTDINGLIPIYVVPTSGYTDAPGVSHQDNFHLTTNVYPGMHTRRYLYFGLNTHYLGINAVGSAGGDADYWAGVIGRLFLQNLGISGLKESEEKFLLAYQECIQFPSEKGK